MVVAGGEPEAIGQRELVAALAGGSLLPGPAAGAVRETHMSWVFLAGDRAYKLKKAVDLGFADFRSAERRQWACEEETRVNQALAGGVYLGVRPIVAHDGRLELGGLGERRADAVDHLVEMRRFDEADTMQARARAGRLDAGDVEAVAATLARFHADAAIARGAGAERAAHAWDRNLEELYATGADARLLERQQRSAWAYLLAHRSELDARAAAGLVREGHGDLRAEHVILGDAPAIVDRLEFDAGLRTVDVAADLAFLVMDLRSLGCPRAAELLVDAYRKAGGDPGPEHLLAFHATQRALVRMKVAALRADHDAAAGLAALAERLRWRARGPCVLVICGPAASGKSTLAGAVARRSGFAVLSSDRLRKARAGLAATARAAPALYTPERDLDTYAALGAEAARDAGRGVVVDATFRRRELRRAFLDALGAQAVFAECRVPPAALAARARARAADPDRISDAGERVALEHAREFEPLDEPPRRDALALAADRPAAETLDALEAALDRRLAMER